MNIIKRNGTEVPFERKKIVIAVSKANQTVIPTARLTERQIERIAEDVESAALNLNRALHVEELQDIVENEIMSLRAFEVARSYITYRYKRAMVRKSNTTDEQIMALIENNNEEVKQENSNKNPTVVSVQRDYMAGEVSKDITKRFLLPPDVVDAHEKGIIHFHDADYFSQRMHNCFTGGTKLITDRGVLPFKVFKDGEEITVKDLHGVLRKATVHKYGKQKMQKVTLQSGRRTTTVICTANHKWILANGERTTNLQIGDYLYRIEDSTDININSKEEADAFVLGFLVGDGVDADKGGHEGTSIIRLCGEKTKYVDIFKKAGFSAKNIKGSDTDLCLYRYRAVKQDFINGKGWRYMTPEHKALAFKGYYAADGAVDSNRLATADERLKPFIEETSGLAGYYISSVQEVVRDTNFKKDAKLITYHFVTKMPENMVWKVTNIVPYGHGLVDAWCVEEPITHSFTLEGGIVTGNCDLVNLEDMLQNGTVISNTMIEKPHSFAVACNIATQVVAQIASSQYGGQSISLTHLAPFVDISRKKIRKEVEDEMKKAKITTSEDAINEIVETRVLKEIKRGVQIIQYQVLTLMTTNGQAPFITVFMYLGEAKNEQEKKDLALIIEEVLKQRYQGVKNEEGVWITPAFPKLIYVLEEDNIHENSKYYYLTKLAAKCTAKRMVPDYISEKKMKELKEGNCFPVMGCRSALAPWKDENGNYKFYGRFNCGVVTLNLVDVGLSANKDLNSFWKILDERLELCHKALKCRHERLRTATSDLAPILWRHGALLRLSKGEKIEKYLYGGYSSISLGYAGLWECVYALIGRKLT